MRSLPIIMKFQAVLAVLALVAIVATGYMALELKHAVNQGARISSTSMRAAIDVANAKEEIERARADLLDMKVLTNAQDIAKLTGSESVALADFNNNMKNAAGLFPDYAGRIDSMRKQGNALINDVCVNRSKAIAQSASPAAQAQTVEESCMEQFLPYGLAMTAIRTQALQDLQQKYVVIEHVTFKKLIYTMIALIFGIIVVAVLSYVLIKSTIVTPINRLNDVMNRLREGEDDVRVPETDRHDEIGKMARTVVVFQKAAIEKKHIEEAARKAAEEVEAERIRNEAIRAQEAAVQAAVVEGLAGGLERLSSGDLMFRITKTFSSDYEKLRVDFNQAMENLQQTMQKISQNFGSLRSSAGEITQSADDLSRRTEQQAASLEQTAAALDEITVTVRKASEGSNEARTLANEAKTDAERSGVVVKDTVTAMSEIEDSSKKISNIIGVIDEIAFQTNLLALNAGVEAARAGDAGRGFAVVATEVRALAQRSADAAKEIKVLISASGAQVQGGVRLVNETGQALGRIVTQVGRLNVLITEIAASSQEQATALGEVNSAVNQMDQVTQQNAAMVEQSTAASHALAREAEELMQLVGKFRVSTDVITPISLASNKKERSKPTETNHVQNQKTRPYVMTAGDDWDEF